MAFWRNYKWFVDEPASRRFGEATAFADTENPVRGWDAGGHWGENVELFGARPREGRSWREYLPAAPVLVIFTRWPE